MQDHGVDRSLVIPFPVVEDYREAHDEIAEAIQDFPNALTGCICLDPFVGRKEFRNEVRRCVEKPGFRALKLQPQYQPLNPISPRSDFFFETALEFRLPVVCHTGAAVPFALPSLFIQPARRFPELTIILAHAGGSLTLEILNYVDSSRLLVGSYQSQITN